MGSIPAGATVVVEGEESSPCAVNARQASSSLVDHPNGAVVQREDARIGSLETRVRFPATPRWAARRARAGLQNQPRRVRVPGCLQRRANMAGPWPGRKPVRALGLSVRFRRFPPWKTNAAGPRTALKRAGTAGSGIAWEAASFARRGPSREGSQTLPRSGYGRQSRPPPTRFARLPRRVARTVRGRLAKPRPVVVSPEQVRLLHSPPTICVDDLVAERRGTGLQHRRRGFDSRRGLDCDGNPGRSSQALPRSGSAGQSPATPTRLRPRCQRLHA